MNLSEIEISYDPEYREFTAVVISDSGDPRGESVYEEYTFADLADLLKWVERVALKMVREGF